MDWNTLSGFALVHLIQVTVLFLVIWLVHIFVAKKYPHFLFLLWLVFFIKCLVPPVVVSPTSAFQGWGDRYPNVFQNDKPSNAKHAVLSKNQSQAARFENVSEDLKKKWKNRRAHQNTASPTFRTNGSNWPARPFFPAFLLTVWFFGSATLWLSAVFYYVLVRRRVLRSQCKASKQVQGMFLEMVTKTGLPKNTQLIVNGSGLGPLLFGIFRAKVVIPEALAKMDLEQIRPVIAHELCHLRRRDHWLGILQVTAISVFWFHPMVWLASRLMSQLCEICCDDDTIGIFQFRPTKYARGLLSVLETVPARTVYLAPGVRAAELTKKRIQTIVETTRVSLFRSSGILITTIILLLVIPFRSSSGWSVEIDSGWWNQTDEQNENSPELDTGPRNYVLDELQANVLIQMDPFVGRWRISNPTGKNLGTTEFGFEANGKILRENLKGAFGDTGHGISYFDPGQRKWKVTWVDSSGAVSDLAGSWNGSAIDLVGTNVSADGFKSPCRNTLIPISGNEFQVQLWFWDNKKLEWKKTSKLFYNRISERD